MRLVTVHKLLIMSAMLATTFYFGWTLWMYGRDHDGTHLVAGALAGAADLGLLVYLVLFIRKTRNQNR